ncbi:Sec7-domain-containing protein [Cryphonectria parasitica EP155]|uniref:Sec7-domain-containing protein n=1 Tax=Cryphonectria parasitica (strain ATCC 38755 / EP155) TaxID=660469 RepID=A0A9P5CQR9_CRYP1|nr:Sec7-domain-containing protein [Cryphonectria parasitica EP155]KAF3767493.1 Sec7-domain-containing protein [Cryphonectria parasitica EP155]
MEPQVSPLPSRPTTPLSRRAQHHSPRMQYRSRPVAVAVDPVSLVIAECIAITSACQKHARSPHSSVAAILGGGPSPVQLGPSNSVSLGKGRSKTAAANITGDGTADLVRWGLRGKKGKSMQDNPLISGFGRLRHELTGVKDIHKFDALTMLYPFLQIVQAKGTAAPVTILALRAIRKFLAYGFISPESPRFAVAMQSLSAAITHCQFDISDSAQEEVVLLMILHLMEDMLSGPGGDILSDESVCDMMGRGLTICSRPRFSEVLRQTAEASMVRMCQIIFEDLKHLEEEAGEESDALDKKTNGDMDTVNMDPSANGTEIPVSAAETASDLPRTSESASTDSSGTAEADQATIASETATAESLDLRPYSLPSVRELFRVLVNFLDPHDRKHPDTMRVMALRIIHVALEVAGPSIARHPALATIAEDRLCFYLFQLIRSDHTAILQESLLVAGTLLSTCRGVLKLQQEKFLSYLVACLHVSLEIPREPGIDPSLYADIPQTPKLVRPPPSQMGSGRATPVPVRERQSLGLEGGARKPDARQAMVENICVLARMPTFLVELFVNYDCDPNLADLCEDMVGMLSRNALPDSATWSTTSVPPLCLDALLRYIQSITERLDQPPQADGYPDPLLLREQRRRKKLIIKGMNKFNESTRGGLAFLQDKGIIESATDPECVAAFLRSTTLASKKVLGEFISKRGNEAILDAFLDSFDFTGKRVDEALRSLLETFRLPGESPLIERIVTSFSKKFLDSDIPGEVANPDAAYVLTYATIMLNTDQHNPNVKSQARMKVEDFARNLRGVNDGKDFAPEYLQAVYDAIKTNEIILPEEHDNKHALDYAWKELLSKTEAAGPLITCDTNIYDADMFAATWRPIVSTLSYVFMSATDDTVFMRIVSGFDECARIAAKYNITEALDQIIYTLSVMTTLSTEMVSNTSLNTEVQVDERSVMVSELAVKLGRNFRAQLAILVLFRVVTSKEHIIRKGWKDIIRIWLNLFVNSLITFSSDRSKLALSNIPLRTPQQVINRANKQNDTGLFSAFSNFISSYAADDPPEPSQEELDSTLSTVDCINQCQMDDIFANISNLPDESLEALVDALLDQIPEDSGSEAVITVKADNVPSSSPALAQKPNHAVAYDPGLVYILELSTVQALRDNYTVQLLGKRVVDALQAILRDLSHHHPIIIARTTFYLFRLLQASYEYDFIRVPILLHTVSSFPPELLRKTSKLILQGIKLCVDEPGPLRNEMMTSPDFWAILRNLSTVPQVAPVVFDILETGVMPPSTAIMADNYEAAITLLNEFASAASATVTKEPKPDRRQPRKAASRPNSAKAEASNPVVQRGIKAVNIIYSMTSRIPQLIEQSHLETNEAWSAYWLPIFEALTTQCTNPRREVRQLAFNSLQRALFSPELTSSDHREWTAIFGEVLFPLILKLLKPEVFSTDRDGMSETRVQAASLLCKVFLQYLVLLSEWDGMLDLWLKIIDIMDRLMNSGQGDSLEEAVPENLKNVLLFMSSNGYLVPPSKDPSKEKIWSESWKRIDRFLPDLRKDLALDVEEEQQTKEAAAAADPPPPPAEEGEKADEKSA